MVKLIVLSLLLNMSEASSTLETARFFLDKMVETPADLQSVKHYLNAFLSSARSVTWVLQKEFSSKPGFNAWYNSKTKSIDPENDFSLFNDLRNTSIKERSIYPNPTISATDAIGFEESYRITLHDKNGNIIKEATGGTKTKEIPKIEKKITRSFIFEERPDDDAFALCERYYSKLKDVVIECELSFSS
jgi:hypothetical protein